MYIYIHTHKHTHTCIFNQKYPTRICVCVCVRVYIYNLVSEKSEKNFQHSSIKLWTYLCLVIRKELLSRIN